MPMDGPPKLHWVLSAGASALPDTYVTPHPHRQLNLHTWATLEPYEAILTPSYSQSTQSDSRELLLS